MSRITMKEACEILGVTRSVIYNHVRKGNLAKFKHEDSREIFFYKEEVEELKLQMKLWCTMHKHGMHGTRIYNIWANMRARCANGDDVLYGGRGITICDEWETFPTFYEWAKANGYKDEPEKAFGDQLSIERIDVNGNYCPENCTWIPMREQSKNQRKSIFVTIANKTLPLKEIAVKYQIPYSSITIRYKKGERGRDLIRPVKEIITVAIKGENLTIREAGSKYHIATATIRSRYDRGKRGNDLIKPVKKRKYKQEK